MKTLKALQITYNGEPMRKVFPYATRWQVVKFKTIKFLIQLAKVVGLAVIIGLTIAAAFKIGQRFPAQYQIAGNTVVDNLPAKISQFKTDYLNALSGCEAPGYKAGDAPIIFDSNAKPSIGPYMFQIKTVVYYEKTLYNKIVTPAQAVEIALDPTQARQLAADINFTTANESTDWLNCSRKLGLPDQLKVIKQLQS